MAFLLIWMGCLTAMGATLYSTLSSYQVSCDELTMLPGTKREVTLYLTNPAEMKPAFQVDVFLPTGIEPTFVGSALDYALPVGNATITSTYNASIRCLRILVTGNNNWAASSRQAVATIKLQATSQFVVAGTVKFTNFIFTRKSDNRGYYGSPVNVNATGAQLTGDVTGNGVVGIEDVNAIINIMLGKAQASDYPGIADVTGNGIVGIEDVNAVINTMLGKE